jgi:DNA-binding NtrC family response regulator
MADHDTAADRGRILVADDDPHLRRLFMSVLARQGHEVSLAADGAEAVRLLRERAFDVLLVDLTMAPVGGLEVLETARRDAPETLVVIVTGNATVESAIGALRRGAYDYILKPVQNDELALLVGRAVQHRRLGEERRRTAEALRAEQQRNSALVRDLRSRYALEKVLGRSERMRQVRELVQEVLATDSTVLILGESGTGKGLLAHVIHYNSSRAEGPFVEVNCSVYPEGVLQSELFGHERGAFTGAIRQKKGRFEAAREGTVFLDEIGEISLATQVMLLRFLQEHTFERVGGEETLEADVRVVAATNRDLLEAIRRGHFREDLYYRLNVIPIHLPPLRERVEDLPVLAEEILARCAARLGRPVEGFAPEAMEALIRHRWPGNIRELENVIERAVLLSRGGAVEAHHLPPEVAAALHVASGWIPRPPGAAEAVPPPRVPPAPPASGAREAAGPHMSLDEAERAHILKVLEACGGNKKKAAALLGINRSSLYAKLKRLGIVPAGGLAGVA